MSERTVRDILREALLALRNDDQGGYSGYRGDGEWESSSYGLHVESSDLNRLFEFAGIVPDKIVSLGGCDTCQHSGWSGMSRGWSQPCAGCSGPKMTRWKQRKGFTKRLIANIEKLEKAVREDHRLSCSYNHPHPYLVFRHQMEFDTRASTAAVVDASSPTGLVKATNNTPERFRMVCDVQPHFWCGGCGAEIEVPFTLEQLKQEVLP